MALKNWSTPALAAVSTEEDLISVPAGSTAIVIGMNITNRHSATIAFKVNLYDSSAALKAVLLDNDLEAGKTITLDTKQVVQTEEKIKVEGDNVNVSFSFSGDESVG